MLALIMGKCQCNHNIMVTDEACVHTALVLRVAA
jgi:hypothetical protein